MNLLMVTRRVDVDDDRVGYTHRLINCLAKRVAGLGVICLERGRVELPPEVRLFSMGKEKGYGRLREFMNYQRALAVLAPKADVIFGHMNPIYTILAAPWAKLFRRKLVMWYAHGHVSRQLKLAHLFVDKVVTPTPESFRLPSRKLQVIGHAIDTRLFHPAPEQQPTNGTINLLSVSRLSPVKDIECILQALYTLIHQHNISKLHLRIVGGPGTPKQVEYVEMLRGMANDLGLDDKVSFVGAVGYQETVRFYQSAHLFLSMSRTGSLDKSNLEAMACGCLPLSCNQAQAAWMNREGFGLLNTPEGDAQALAQNMCRLLEMEPAKRQVMQEKVRRMVVKEHDVEDFVERLCRVFENV